MANTPARFLACIFSFIGTLASAAEPTLGERLSQVQVEKHADAPGYSEGPTWRDGEVFFCSGALLRAEKDGRVRKYLNINPAGTVLLKNGSLLIADNKHKALLELTSAGALNVIAERFEGKPLQSLNDLTVDADGNIYWSDPENSSLKNPVGSVFRVTPDGTVSKVASGLAFPNGLDVDPAGKFLYVIESQSKKIIRYAIAGGDKPLGKAEEFYDLGGSGGDGCAFDAEGNLWVADYHRPETKKGRIAVLSPAGKLLGTLEIPAQAVSNIAFGGPEHDTIFCTTGNPGGVYRAKVGVKGFRGHPGKPLKVVRQIGIAPEELASPVHPRRFGSPGGVGPTRGWYVWESFDPKAWTAEVRNESSGTRYSVRVLPWATTYRHRVYGTHVDEISPGERVNLFFSPDDKQQRGYLVHFQDEIGQMHGHGHVWELQSVGGDGKTFTARGLAKDKPLDDKTAEFRIDATCTHWRNGDPTQRPKLAKGDRLFMVWGYAKSERVVRLTADAESLDALKKLEEEKVAKRLAADGLAGLLERASATEVEALIFPTYWSQAAQLQKGQTVQLKRTAADFSANGDAIEAEVLNRRNLGIYGSGATELVLKLKPADAKTVAAWGENAVIRVFGR